MHAPIVNIAACMGSLFTRAPTIEQPYAGLRSSSSWFTAHTRTVEPSDLHLKDCTEVPTTNCSGVLCLNTFKCADMSWFPFCFGKCIYFIIGPFQYYYGVYTSTCNTLAIVQQSITTDILIHDSLTLVYARLLCTRTHATGGVKVPPVYLSL